MTNGNAYEKKVNQRETKKQKRKPMYKETESKDV